MDEPGPSADSGTFSSPKHKRIKRNPMNAAEKTIMMNINKHVQETWPKDAYPYKYMTLTDLVGDKKDTKDFWQMAELLALLRKSEASIDFSKCDENGPVWKPLQFPTTRTVTPVCNAHASPSVFGYVDSLVCPTCPQLDNHTECELFRDSCKERRVKPEEYLTYCDDKYGKWRTMFVPADYNICRCCDECIFYREMDQSCVQDNLHFEIPENLPVITIDFRAGCNPYLGHPEQELKALRCDKVLRRCVPVALSFSDPTGETRRRNHDTFVTLEAPVDDCPTSCKNYKCPKDLSTAFNCPYGAFMPEKNTCNCCGHCSRYQQIDEICAIFKKTEEVNGTQETEVEEEFLEPGCDDGLVCRFGKCQDIHAVQPKYTGTRRFSWSEPYEPCRKELREFKRKYGDEGHLHFNAPQCTPLWLYAAVQCRRFVCNCAMEDGTIIAGTKTPRAEVANVNCDCAREKCRSGRADIECDGYGNYKQSSISFHQDQGELDQPGLQGSTSGVKLTGDSERLERNDLWDVNYK